jgi:hypothetical protein
MIRGGIVMEGPVVLSDASRTTAGILLLAIIAVQYGGWYMLRIVRGREPATRFQVSFARAGHAHAGVLVTLGLVAQILVDATELTGGTALLARGGVPWAAILMPAGFFLSSAGRGRSEPSRLIILLYAGIVALTVGVVALGVGLLTA